MLRFIKASWMAGRMADWLPRGELSRLELARWILAKSYRLNSDPMVLAQEYTQEIVKSMMTKYPS